MPLYELTAPAQEGLKDIARYTLKEWGKKQSIHYAELTEEIIYCHRESPRIVSRKKAAIRSKIRRLFGYHTVRPSGSHPVPHGHHNKPRQKGKAKHD